MIEVRRRKSLITVVTSNREQPPAMSDDLIFAMGKYEARIPTDRHYSKNHMWVQKSSTGDTRVGLTAYSVRLLQDVYFLEWSIDPDSTVTNRQEIGEIESSKAVSSLHTPCDGRILEFNEDLLNDPSHINADTYGAGWLYTMQTDADLLSAQEYLEHQEQGWEKDQRLIKGQVN